MKTKNTAYKTRWTPEERERVLRKNVFTTGDLALLFGVAPRTISKWFDSGEIKGFRIPRSLDRRIPRASLARFLETRDFGFKLSDPNEIRVLCVGFHPEQFEQIAKEASGIADYARASSGFAAGAMITSYLPTHVAIDLAIGRIDAHIVASGCRAELPDAKIIGYGLIPTVDAREFDAIVFGADKLLRAVMAKKGGV